MFKKILYGIALVAAFTSCNGDYKDWADPMSNAQGSTVDFGNGSVASVGTINLADYAAGSNVKVCDITAVPTVEDSSYKITRYEIMVNGVNYGAITENGEMNVDDLSNVIVNEYGKRPTERQVTGQVIAYLVNDTKPLKIVSESFPITAIPEAPEIDSKYYVTGSINGWDNTNTTYEVVNSGKDVYEDPVFTVSIPAADVVGKGTVEFKLTPVSGLGGDWSKCITAAADGTEGKLADKNAGGNITFKETDGAQLYKLTFNLLDQTYSWEAISYKPLLWYVGTTAGWDNSGVMKLGCTDNTKGIYEGFIYQTEESYGNTFRFMKTPGSWDYTVGYSDFSNMSGDVKAGGSDNNLEATAGTGLYYVKVDFSAQSIKMTKISNMNLVGDFNGWNEADDAQQMTWDAANYCFVINNAGVTSNGWKFTANNKWDINLGGELDNLVSNGGNLSAVGSTIKLYPCRTASDNIIATVE